MMEFSLGVKPPKASSWRRSAALAAILLTAFSFVCAAQGQGTQPIVAIHDSELTRALESTPASGATPTGSGTTGYQWWPTDWHYFVMPESVKEALRSDGTAFTVVGDSNITAGLLLANGVPKYPILISLASEAIRDDEIAPLTNYVAAGGVLLVGSSSFTRTPTGTTRGDFAIGNAMGVRMANASLSNWTNNNYLTTQTSHALIADIPSGQLTWRMPSASDEIPWGISPSHPFLAAHDIWQVKASGATVLAQGDSSPLLLVKPYGKGLFIYNAAFQPLIGHSGFAPGMYAYMLFRRSIEWAFASANLPVPKLSPWPYQYDAAFMIRHDLENFTNEVAAIQASAQVEYNNGAKGDYYFCTGTVRDDVTSSSRNSIIAGLRQAVTNYGATIGPHNGGLKNPNNSSLKRGDYDYWHWGPDEALDVTPAGYASGKAYAFTSISNSFRDVEGWLSGITNGLRAWVGCYFNATREDSYDLQAALKVNIAGEQKLTPFPHWTLSTRTAGLRYSMLSEPVSDWFVGGLVAQSLEPWHPPGVYDSTSLHSAVDFYYKLGALINIYSHTLSTGLGDAGALVADYITYSLNTNTHPRVWSANAVGVYQWWLQRSNAQMNVSYSTNGGQYLVTVALARAANTNTAIEILIPGTNSFCGVSVLANGYPADTNSYRINGQVIKLRVGTAVTNAVIGYYPQGPSTPIFTESFDSVTAPALPAGWSTSTSGAQSAWVTQTGANDTAPNAAFSTDAANTGVNELVSPPIAVPVGSAQLSFRNNYDLESSTGGKGYDGGVLEVKIGSGSFIDIVAAGGSFVIGGYNATIDSGYANPLAGRSAWSGNSGGYLTTLVNLPSAAAGQTIQLKWRCGSDNGVGKTGWRIDTVAVSSRACACCGSTTNAPPVLPVQIGRTIAELASLVVTNTATDTNVPPQALSYKLVAPPSGASIDGSGIITWIPNEAQGPGTYTLTTIVTDNGAPPLSATNSFSVNVTEVNAAPVLPAQASRTILELTPMLVTNAATDPDVPANALSYALLNPPDGAVISASGVISWTPTHSQAPSTNLVTTVVTDNGVPPLSSTNTFAVLVLASNTAPVLPLQNNLTIAELTSLVVTNAAADADFPPNTLTYALVAPPPGAGISPAGVITWTPNEAQGPGTYTITTVVTDNGLPRLSATNSFSVAVTEVNSAPVLPAQPGRTISAQVAMVVSNTASDSDLPANLLSYTLVSPPGGVAIDQNGVITWTPTSAQAPSTNVITTVVTDNGAPPLSATNSFAVVVTSGPSSNTVFLETFDGVTAPALPAGWTSSATGGESAWVTRAATNDTAPNSVYVPDPATVGTSDLVSPAIALPAGTSRLSFRNNYNLEAGTGGFYDGGVLEIKVGAGSFTDILAAGGTFVSGGYNSTISAAYASPIASRQAWSSNSVGYVTTVVSLPAAAAGQAIQLRWRCATDNGNSGTIVNGWYIDTVAIVNCGCACCWNGAPVLTAQTNRTINELATLIVTNAATDPESPPQTLTYALVNPPSGATIDAAGVIRWTPAQTQSPSTNIIKTTVTDSGSPALSATNSFTVTVREVNVAPTLPAIPAQSVLVQTLLTVTNAAANANIHSTISGYRLASAPSGATISTNGVITWTPSPAQVPSTNIFTTVVTNYNPYDSVNPRLTATNSFTVYAVVSGGPLVALDSAALTAESFTPTNGVVDSGETVTLVFALRNVGAANTTNLVATLLETNGVSAPTGPQTYGLLVAGGVPASQAFSFTASGTCGGAITPTLQLQDGAANVGTVALTLTMGQVGIVVTQNFDTVAAPALPSGWTTSATGVESPWVTRATSSSSPPNAGYIPDPANIGTSDLVSPSIVLPLGASQLTFNNNYNLEADSSGYYDGGVLEIKIGAGTFTDILAAGGSFVSGGYNATISAAYSSPIASRQAWTGNSAGYITTVVNLPAAAAGQTVQLRWRGATDVGNGNTVTNGWSIDNIGISGRVCAVGAMARAPQLMVAAPVIQTLQVVGENVVIGWSTVSDHTYRVQYSSGLGNNWKEILPDVQATGQTMTVTNSAANLPPGFYRVLLVQ
jgi:hypothetical protein